MTDYHKEKRSIYQSIAEKDKLAHLQSANAELEKDLDTANEEIERLRGENSKIALFDADVMWFASEMCSVLDSDKNRYKGGWEDMSNEEILKRIDNEVAELKQVCSCRVRDDRHRRRLIREAVDVANFCMFIADNNKPNQALQGD